MPGGFWNEEKDEIAKQMLRCGSSASEVAAVLGTTKSAVGSRAHRAGYDDLLGEPGRYDRKKSIGTWTEKEDEYVASARKAGKTWEEIASHLGRTKSAVEGRIQRIQMREVLGGFEHERPVHNFNPIYDPKRDGSLSYADLTAELMGDPPIGRREIMQKLEASHG